MQNLGVIRGGITGVLPCAIGERRKKAQEMFAEAYDAYEALKLYKAGNRSQVLDEFIRALSFDSENPLGLFYFSELKYGEILDMYANDGSDVSSRLSRFDIKNLRDAYMSLSVSSVDSDTKEMIFSRIIQLSDLQK